MADVVRKILSSSPTSASLMSTGLSDDENKDTILHCSFPGCNKSFNSRWSMTRHFRTHTGERPFKCSHPGCNKEFVQKCSLTRHEQTHLEDKQWMCDYPGCGRKFKLKEYLGIITLVC